MSAFIDVTFTLCDMLLLCCHRRGSAGRPLISIHDFLFVLSDLVASLAHCIVLSDSQLMKLETVHCHLRPSVQLLIFDFCISLLLYSCCLLWSFDHIWLQRKFQNTLASCSQLNWLNCIVFVKDQAIIDALQVCLKFKLGCYNSKWRHRIDDGVENYIKKHCLICCKMCRRDWLTLKLARLMASQQMMMSEGGWKLWSCFQPLVGQSSWNLGTM